MSDKHNTASAGLFGNLIKVQGRTKKFLTGGADLAMVMLNHKIYTLHFSQILTNHECTIIVMTCSIRIAKCSIRVFVTLCDPSTVTIYTNRVVNSFYTIKFSSGSLCCWQSSASLLESPHINTCTYCSYSTNVYIVAIHNFTSLCKHSKIFTFIWFQGV